MEKFKVPVRDKKGHFTGKYKEVKPVFGFKGYNEDLRCLGKQYKVGETFTETGGSELCAHGMMHFCRNLRDVFQFYPPCSKKNGTATRYTEVKALAPVKTLDSKSATKKLYIGKELSLPEVAEKVEHSSLVYRTLNNECKATRHPYGGVKNEQITGSAIAHSTDSLAVTTGFRGLAACMRDRSAAVATGASSLAFSTALTSFASVEGPESIATSISGCAEAKNSNSVAVSQRAAKGELGSWLVLIEVNFPHPGKSTVKAVKVDGKKIQADTYYTLDKGKVQELLWTP